MKTLFQTSSCVRSNADWCLPHGVTELDDERARLWRGGWEELPEPPTEADTETDIATSELVDPFEDYPELLEELLETLIMSGEAPTDWEFEFFMEYLGNDAALDIFLDL